MAARFRFNKAVLEALEATDKRQYFYDTEIPQLGVTVLPSGKITFHVRVTEDGQSKRVGINRGTFPAMQVPLARDEAKKILGENAKGVNIAESRRSERIDKALAELTVEDAVDLFCANKVRRISTGQKFPIKDSTKEIYKKTIKRLLGDDYQKSLLAVTEGLLAKKVSKVPQITGSNGLRSLSSVWNWIGKQEAYRGKMPPNPVRQYSDYHEGLHVPPPRDRRIPADTLPAFFTELDKRPVEAQEALLWALLTGCRPGEVEGLTWDYVNLKDKTYTLPDPKNRRPAVLPIPPSLLPALRKRKQKTGRVFPLTLRAHLDEITEALDIKLSPHDLRRTHAGICNGVLPETSAKRLQNRVLIDVFHHYVGTSADLHDEIAKVERELYRLAGRPLDNVQALRAVQ
ncbi:integrase family protein [Haliea sp. E1-2-M8]|uniref:tyrosine-type recombinase/integrase n=1 Tax=Haliea sp. E1-2-M8 TaxID=3064706 RepID=UPI00271C010E|nr:integrase family protein [Haliea sp. E1-2-M8]MDO8864050.1 integrase family protein [Haliea sp. E1-2-M8]